MPEPQAPPAFQPPAFSAGVVVARRDDSGWRLLVLRAYRNWDFPKGTLEAGETPLDAALRETMEGVIFAETTTFGIRSHLASRHKLARTFETVETGFGPVRIKVGRRQGRIVAASPEFEDCREAAIRASRPLREVMDLAMRIWWSKNAESEPV